MHTNLHLLCFQHVIWPVKLSISLKVKGVENPGTPSLISGYITADSVVSHEKYSIQEYIGGVV